MSAKNVKRLRERLGLSQEDLARALGLHGKGAIYRWEDGLRKPGETLRRLICYLNDLPIGEAQKLLETLKAYGKRKTGNVSK